MAPSPATDSAMKAYRKKSKLLERKMQGINRSGSKPNRKMESS